MTVVNLSHRGAAGSDDEGIAMDDIKPVRVRVTLILDVDPVAWELNYGISGRREIQEDVKDYVRTAVRDGHAGFENMTLVEAK